ncbi:cobalt-zinc-cadmium efflux system protein [Thermotomaculum hydrothermale]|uniref:Cobalt-zinc-cadmium efflux system protein n=1 Tax=Thermotomaculum hydrothermale TaxID=981385 RepID=A0A7R6SZ74_9BACT|nr:cation diffusion facilitator family transporter [Thermotomaculum hydrothermale]BBB33346.1 cobalt-zinc-cadmium efflux system protein [Thermotomaculum hydrothermale]
MAHHHHHEHKLSGFRLFITILINIFITVAQVIGALYSNSLSLLSDAMHNFSDVVALIVSWVANHLAGKDPDERKTFGYRRAEIIAALFNSAVLVGIAISLLYHAVLKLIKPEEVKSLIVIYLALLSIILNFLSVLIIKKDASNNMNIKSAYLHLLTDVMTSVAVFVGGLVMLQWNLYYVDPIISIVIAVYLGKESFALVKETIEVLMQFAPENIKIEDVKKGLEDFEFVDNVHHLHLWRLSDHEVFLEAHVDFKENISLEKATKEIEKMEKFLNSNFGITHVTLQSEFNRKDDKSLIKNHNNHRH